MIRTHALLTGGILVALAACCASTRSATAAQLGPASFVSLRYVSSETRTYGTEDAPYQRVMDLLDLVNESTQALAYVGEAKDWPVYERRSLTPNGWEDERILVFCDLGLEQQVLIPGETARLVVHSFQGTNRVGIRLRDLSTGEATTVWSEPFCSRDAPYGE